MQTLILLLVLFVAIFSIAWFVFYERIERSEEIQRRIGSIVRNYSFGEGLDQKNAGPKRSKISRNTL